MVKKNIKKIHAIDNGDPRLVGHYVEGYGIVQKTKRGIENEEMTKNMSVAEMFERIIKLKKDKKR